MAALDIGIRQRRRGIRCHAYIYPSRIAAARFRFGAGGGEMISVTGNAARLFTTVDQEVPPGPLDIPKLFESATKCGVHVVA